MCQFFSFTTKGTKRYYFNWEQRKALLKDNPNDYDLDSHSSINHFYNLDDDKVIKYEYNPLTKKFQVDQINIKDDRALALKWVEKLDFKTVVEPLIIKPVINPFELPKAELNDKHIELLKQWDSVGDLVRASVGASVLASVRALVGVSVWDSVGDSVGDSVRASVWVYIGGLFPNIDKWKYVSHKKGCYPFQSCVDLWYRNLVPSYDSYNKIWRLHSGKKAGIVFEISEEELKRQ